MFKLRYWKTFYAVWQFIIKFNGPVTWPSLTPPQLLVGWYELTLMPSVMPVYVLMGPKVPPILPNKHEVFKDVQRGDSKDSQRLVCLLAVISISKAGKNSDGFALPATDTLAPIFIF